MEEHAQKEQQAYEKHKVNEQHDVQKNHNGLEKLDTPDNAAYAKKVSRISTLHKRSTMARRTQRPPGILSTQRRIREEAYYRGEAHCRGEAQCTGEAQCIGEAQYREKHDAQEKNNGQEKHNGQEKLDAPGNTIYARKDKQEKSKEVKVDKEKSKN